MVARLSGVDCPDDLLVDYYEDDLWDDDRWEDEE